jgi:23S rRNA (cytosine1962-C5)-methyltransferase
MAAVPIKKVFLKRNEEKRINSGHPWVFSNEIREIQGAPSKGDIVETYDNLQRFLGQGFFNPSSLIAVRLITRSQENIDTAFWARKISKALEYRKTIYPDSESFRAFFGESDGIPGLIVDKYGSYLSLQFLSAGIEKNQNEIIEALKQVFNPAGIIARNDSFLRKLEGLEEKTEILYGDIPNRIKIEENGILFWVDISSGQKTGFYFDQRDNRHLFSKYCKGKKILDCFCHTGAFGIYALKAGAKEVIWLDSSKSALEKAEENADLNAFKEKFNGILGDASDYLCDIQAEKEKFDIINLDPPALIKSKKDFNAGFKAYVKLNASALKLLGGGGILATSSCSHNLSQSDFREVLKDACAKSDRQVRILGMGLQAKDHPILISMPETEYLKFALLEVM